MKTSKILALFALVAILASGATAQTLQQGGLGASWMYSDDLDNGYGATAKYVLLYQDLAPRVAGGLDIRSGWTTFDGEDNDYDTDVDVYPVEITALLDYEVADGANPYVGVGAGYYFFDVDDEGGYDVDDDYGVYGLVGWDQNINKQVSVFAEAKYLWLEPDVDGPYGFSDDIDAGGCGVTLGLNYNW